MPATLTGCPPLVTQRNLGASADGVARAARESGGRAEGTHESRAGELMLKRLARSFENTTTSATGWLQVACVATTLRHRSRERGGRRRAALAA
ncbi:MAG: hypothetical protein ACRDO2_15220 [Nocardioidaceae bacterium]